MNRLTLVACAVLLAAAATLSAQMHELGHWHGGHFLGPSDSGYRDRNESRQEFRHDMRARGRQWRYEFRGDRWN